MRLFKNSIDKTFHQGPIQKELNSLAEFYEYPKHFLTYNSNNFSSWNGVVCLGGQKLQTFYAEFLQENLIERFLEIKNNISLTVLAIKLKMNRGNFIQFYYKLRMFIDGGVPFLLSIGNGLRLMNLLNEEEKRRCELILEEFKIPLSYEKPSTFQLQWE